MLTGVPAGEQQFQFSRGDIDARATIPVIGGATVAVTAAISRRSTVVISPRGNAKPDPFSPAQTPTPATTPSGKVEQIEGIVTANGGGTLTIFDQRLGSVVVTVTPATIIRKGGTPIPLSEILVACAFASRHCSRNHRHVHGRDHPSERTRRDGNANGRADENPTTTPTVATTSPPSATPTETPTP
jgi:hypothetical protein